jgi:hypothetical protein
MHSIPADYVIDLPATTDQINPVVYRQWFGFEVRALREMSYHAVREMNWTGGIKLPAYGYLFVDTRVGEHQVEPLNVVVGAAFFARDVYDDVPADWFMTAVWLHVTARGRGLFTKAMPQMEETFGQFAICGPYSDGFKSLMRSHPQVGSHAIEKFLGSPG